MMVDVAASLTNPRAQKRYKRATRKSVFSAVSSAASTEQKEPVFCSVANVARDGKNNAQLKAMMQARQCFEEFHAQKQQQQQQQQQQQPPSSDEEVHSDTSQPQQQQQHHRSAVAETAAASDMDSVCATQPHLTLCHTAPSVPTNIITLRTLCDLVAPFLVAHETQALGAVCAQLMNTVTLRACATPALPHNRHLQRCILRVSAAPDRRQASVERQARRERLLQKWHAGACPLSNADVANVRFEIEKLRQDTTETWRRVTQSPGHQDLLLFTAVPSVRRQQHAFVVPMITPLTSDHFLRLRHHPQASVFMQAWRTLAAFFCAKSQPPAKPLGWYISTKTQTAPPDTPQPRITAYTPGLDLQALLRAVGASLKLLVDAQFSLHDSLVLPLCSVCLWQQQHQMELEAEDTRRTRLVDLLHLQPPHVRLSHLFALNRFVEQQMGGAEGLAMVHDPLGDMCNDLSDGRLAQQADWTYVNTSVAPRSVLPRQDVDDWEWLALLCDCPELSRTHSMNTTDTEDGSESRPCTMVTVAAGAADQVPLPTIAVASFDHWTMQQNAFTYRTLLQCLRWFPEVHCRHLLQTSPKTAPATRLCRAQWLTAITHFQQVCDARGLLRPAPVRLVGVEELAVVFTECLRQASGVPTLGVQYTQRCVYAQILASKLTTRFARDVLVRCRVAKRLHERLRDGYTRARESGDVPSSAAQHQALALLHL